MSQINPKWECPHCHEELGSHPLMLAKFSPDLDRYYHLGCLYKIWAERGKC